MVGNDDDARGRPALSRALLGLFCPRGVKVPGLFPGHHACLTVRDNGSGIDPGILERIFEPFFTTKGLGEGTGMGLAVVHGIVIGHGGAIAVDSAPGAGTTIRVFRPLAGEAGTAVDPTNPAVVGGTERILVVDDDPALADLGAQLLESMGGYQTCPFTSSSQALEAFRADPQGFDLILTDQTMPTLTGTALAGASREIRPAIPVIVCSATAKPWRGCLHRSLA